MSITTTKFARKPFYVDAVKVTAENIQEVAEWCNGTVRNGPRTDGGPNELFIKVRVQRPMTPRQTQAYIGDWVLYANTGYKVYPEKPFKKSFEEVEGEEGTVFETSFDKEKDEEDELEGVQEFFRSSETGEFVAREYAEQHPETTVKESVIFNAAGDAIETIIQDEEGNETVLKHRSAETGQYVSAEEAEENPATTLSEAEQQKKFAEEQAEEEEDDDDGE